MKKWTPTKVINLSGNYWQICILHSAVKLNIFETIGEDRINSEEIADKLNTDKRATEMLLNALVAMGLLEKKKDEFYNTSFSRDFLFSFSPHYIGDIIMHHNNLMSLWLNLSQAIKKGKPLYRSNLFIQDKEQHKNFLMGMFNLGMIVAPQLAKRIDLTNRRYLLDIGSGPGAYSVHFCLKNPSLKAVLFDLPTTASFAKKVIKRFQLSKRIRFIGGDYLKDEFEGKYDVALLSHILHSHSLKECYKLISKVVSVLEKGSLIIIHDFILNDSMDKPLFPTLFSLNMLLVTKEGCAYSKSQIKDMLKSVGAKDIKCLKFNTPNDSRVMLARV